MAERKSSYEEVPPWYLRNIIRMHSQIAWKPLSITSLFAHRERRQCWRLLARMVPLGFFFLWAHLLHLKPILLTPNKPTNLQPPKVQEVARSKRTGKMLVDFFLHIVCMHFHLSLNVVGLLPESQQYMYAFLSFIIICRKISFFLHGSKSQLAKEDKIWGFIMF